MPSGAPAPDVTAPVPHASAQKGVRLDLITVIPFVVGAALFPLAPFQSESYYIDWMSGFMFGAMIGVSESYLTISRWRDRLVGAWVPLRRGRLLPEETASAAILLAIGGAGCLAFVILLGPVADLTKTSLFVFNFLFSTWWSLWVVYAGFLLLWARRESRRRGAPLRVGRDR